MPPVLPGEPGQAGGEEAQGVGVLGELLEDAGPGLGAGVEEEVGQGLGEVAPVGQDVPLAGEAEGVGQDQGEEQR